MRSVSLLVLLFCFGISVYCQTRVRNLTVEGLANPIGIDSRQPAFSWQLDAPGRNVLQSGYEIRVSTTPSFRSNNIVWSSGPVSSDQSVLVKYGGSELKSGQEYFWQVRVTDQAGKKSDWTPPAEFHIGLLNASDWKAQWIEPAARLDSVTGPSPMLRREFNLNKKVANAKAYITSHGLYEAYLNGKRIGDFYFTPGWTSYNKRLQYQVYDVTNLLQSGANAAGALLGSGWYRGELAWENNRNLYGRNVALLMQIEITFSDGTKETIITDGSWKSSTGAIRQSEIYDGETYDARMKKKDWSTSSYNDDEWQQVVVKDHPKNILIATYNEPVRKHETFKPVKILKTPRGEQVVDFGQNLVGFVQLRITGSAGDSIRIYHAEVLDKEGNFYTENLRGAKQLNTYVLAGNGEEMFEPHFTFQGFRYIRIEGLKGDINPEQLTAVALYSDMKPTGQFTSSHELINQLQKNIQWGQKGNFVDVPTDCPQRDERLGWTGDAQVFARTAAYNMHVRNFFSKWLKDVAADQTAEGAVPHVVPNVLGADASGSAGWADAAVIIPWNMYLIYGDTAILSQQYESMKAWVGFMEKKSRNDLWNQGFHFGDWLFYRPNDDNDGRAAVTDKYLISQCFFANSSDLLSRIARILNKTDDAKYYDALTEKVKEAFRKEYMTSSGRLVSSTQTAYTLALNFNMLPEEMRASAAERLAENVRSYGNHLTTGFLGTPYLCHVLSRFGHTDIAYKLLFQQTYPSWLYPVKMGATTIWERWDGQKPDGTFQTPGMNSFNHYAYGAIGDWMYRVAAGIEVDEKMPGYKHIVFKPQPGGEFKNINASYDSYYGKVSSAWQLDNNNFSWEIEVPANTTATVFVPASSVQVVTEGGKTLTESKLNGEVADKGYVRVKVGSGKYRFTSTL